MNLNTPNYKYLRQSNLSFWFLFTLISILLFSACVVKEELDNTYNQAHLGLNQWSLLEQEDRSYQLVFDAGYLIGLSDKEGVSSIEWTYELITVDRELLSYTQEQMRDASPEKDAIFVEGRRVRTVELDTLLNSGETYILWFTLSYRDEILHEQLFPLVAGEEGGNPNWIAELLGETFEDPDQLINMLPDNSNTMEATANEIGDSAVGEETQSNTSGDSNLGEPSE